MLTQGPAADPKCELNIRLFLTVPYSVTLPNLCKGYHGHFTVTSSDGGMGRLGAGGGGWEGWGGGVVHLC